VKLFHSPHGACVERVGVFRIFSLQKDETRDNGHDTTKPLFNALKTFGDKRSRE
jgi:hypothetical protein